MKRALELLENFFKTLIFWFFLIKQKEHTELEGNLRLTRDFLRSALRQSKRKVGFYDKKTPRKGRFFKTSLFN